MAGTELIIDDDYVNEMADFLNTRATNLQEGIDRYIQILDNIRRDAIKQGATADALDTFISYAKNLSNVVEELGQTAKETCNTFISDVDESDEFYFKRRGIENASKDNTGWRNRKGSHCYRQ